MKMKKNEENLEEIEKIEKEKNIMTEEKKKGTRMSELKIKLQEKTLKDEIRLEKQERVQKI